MSYYAQRLRTGMHEEDRQSGPVDVTIYVPEYRHYVKSVAQIERERRDRLAIEAMTKKEREALIKLLMATE